MDSIASSGTIAVVMRKMAATPAAWPRASSRNSRKISSEIARSRTSGLIDENLSEERREGASGHHHGNEAEHPA